MNLLTPWRIVQANTLLRHLAPWRNYTGAWLHDGKWFRLRDSSASNSLKVVYEEIQRGWYTPPIPIREGDVLLDIGAHVGGWAIPTQASHPEAIVISYEPDPTNYANLYWNIKRNNSRVLPVNAAYWTDLLPMPDPPWVEPKP